MFARSCSESPSAFGRRSWGNPRRQKKIPSGTLYSGSGSQQFVICGGNWGTREPDALSTASALPAGMEDVSARHDIHLAGQHVLMEAVGQDNGPPVGCSDYSPRIIAGKPYSVSLLSRPHVIGALPMEISPCSTISKPSGTLAPAVGSPFRRPVERYLGTRLPQRLPGAGPIDHPCALSWPARPITPKQPLVRTNSKTSSNGATAKDQRCGVLPTQLVFKDRSQRPNTTDGVPTRSEGAGCGDGLHKQSAVRTACGWWHNQKPPCTAGPDMRRISTKRVGAAAAFGPSKLKFYSSQVTTDPKLVLMDNARTSLNTPPVVPSEARGNCAQLDEEYAEGLQGDQTQMQSLRWPDPGANRVRQQDHQITRMRAVYDKKMHPNHNPPPCLQNVVVPLRTASGFWHAQCM